MNNVIRKVDSKANVTTITGALNYLCDSCGTFNNPTGIAVDGSGNIYIADTNNHKIRKISSSGVLSTFAGSGTVGSTDGTGASAQFSYPKAMTIDSSDNLFVKQGNGNNDCFIRKITPGGEVSTFFGNGTCSYDTGNQTIGYEFSGGSTSIDQMVMDSNNNLYTKGDGIYKIDSNSIMTKIYNTSVYGLALDSSQNIIFTTESRIGKLDTTSLQESTLYTYSSNCSFYNTSLQSISNLCGGGLFRTVTIRTNGDILLGGYEYLSIVYPNISQFRLFSLGFYDSNNDGDSSVAGFKRIQYLSTKGGKSYVVDSNKIRLFDGQTVITLSGSEENGNQDGGLNLSQYNLSLKGIGKDLSGRLLYLKTNKSGYYLDSSTQRFKQGTIFSTNTDSKGNSFYASSNQIRKIDLNGIDTLLTGSSQLGSVDGSLQSARFNLPELIHVNSKDEIIIQERKSLRSRKINSEQSTVTSKTISSGAYHLSSSNIGLSSINTIRDVKGNIYYYYNNSQGDTSISKTSSTLNSIMMNVSGISEISNNKGFDSKNSMLILENNIFYKADFP